MRILPQQLTRRLPHREVRLAQAWLIVLAVLAISACQGQGFGSSDAPSVESDRPTVSSDQQSQPGVDAESQPKGPYAGMYIDQLLNNITLVREPQKAQIGEELIRRGPKNLQLIETFYDSLRNPDQATAAQLEMVIMMLAAERGETPGDAVVSSDGSGASGEDARPDSGADSNGPDVNFPNAVPADYDYDEGLRELMAGTEADQSAVDLFVLSRYEKAREAHLDGNNELAIKICQALMLLAPESSHFRSVQQLLLDARTGTQSERLIAGSLRPKQRLARFDAERPGFLERPLEFEITLHNRSNRTIRVDLGDGGEASSSLFTVTRQITERDALDQEFSLAGNMSLRIQGDGEPVELAPGGSPVRVSVTIEDISDISPGGGQRDLLSILQVGGTLRPARIEVQKEGEEDDWERLWRPIALPSVEVSIMPADFPLDEAELTPVAFLRTALQDSQLNRLYLAEHAIPEDRYGAVLDLLLADSIHSAGLLERKARLGLAEALGKQEFGGDADVAQAWWKRTRPYHQ